MKRLPADLHTMTTRSDGSLLAVADVSVADPIHQPTGGQVWAVGPHRLVVADVFTGWPLFVPHLAAGAMLVPYPGPYLLLTNRAQHTPLVLVQPDTYLAGHLLDKYAAVHGTDGIRQLVDGQDLVALGTAA